MTSDALAAERGQRGRTRSKIRDAVGRVAVTGHAMPTFIVLARFTDQGIRNVKETIGRAEAFKEMAKKSGVAVKDLYWTLGRHDVVAVCEAPDDESATALSLSVCSRGNVRSKTLRAFSFEEMKRILGKMV
jgi:uncharacterized protein with GYD domain